MSIGGKILNEINVVVCRQSESEDRLLPVAVRVSKTRVFFKIPNIISVRPGGVRWEDRF